ncbi:hypothetical protein JB92DRAFT_2877537 [Gautieria morchelliformis]|nr:hypothetical protein JB92DRAFT_2877537 [Gautieria morchelliformis]
MHVVVFVILAVYGPAQIFQILYDLSQQLKAMRFGWLILGSALVVASFPPVWGTSACLSVCGFAYGLEGIYVAAPATLVGSGLAFIILRLLFKRQVSAWTSKNEKWQALEQVIAAKGLPLIILIRVSPFPPYVYSQALFASISVVKFWQFMLATVCLQPRIFLAVFIGSQIAKFSDKDERGKMDKTTQMVNALSIAIGLLVGAGTGWFLYRTTQAKIRLLKELPHEVDELAADALEDADEGAPLLLNFSADTLIDVEGHHHASEPGIPLDHPSRSE